MPPVPCGGSGHIAGIVNPPAANKYGYDAAPSQLVAYERLSPAARRAVPTPDHYFPLLYALGASRRDEAPGHRFEGFQAGTLSMRCVQFGV